MIYVKRLNNKPLYINSDLIEFIEETPDTVISLTTGKKMVVEDSALEILDKIIEFKKRIYMDLPQVLKSDTNE